MNSTTAMTSARITGLDFCRAFAIFGMVLVNFKVAMQADGQGPAWLQVITASFDGRAAATFVVLAGIGVSLGAARARRSDDSNAKRQARVNLLKRAVFLTILGWASFPFWPMDILHYYGAYLLVAAAVLFSSNRLLLWGAGIVTALAFIAISIWDYTENWDFDTVTYHGIFTPSGFIRNLFIDGFHPIFPWVGFLLFGMWLGRTDLTNPAWRNRLLLWAVPTVLIIEACAWLIIGPKGTDLEQLPADSWKWLFNVTPMPPTPLYVITGAGTAVIAIWVSIWVTENLPKKLTTPLIATGQMALTLYLAHWFFGLGTLEYFGQLPGADSPGGHESNPQLVTALWASALFSVLAVIFANLWHSFFQRGPVEWLMRKVTQ